jgi:hypothetical protein
MQNVPNIVRERLRAEAVVANHPDPELLTAFAERSLPEGERAVVLEHVSRCGDCREVLSLALPELTAVETSAAPVALRTPWLTWPTLRGAFVAAGVVAIVSVGVLQYQRKSQVATVARSQPHEMVGIPDARNESKLDMQTAPVERDDSAARQAAAPSGDSMSTGYAAPKSAPEAPAAATRTHSPQLGATVGTFANAPAPGGPTAPALQNQLNQNQTNQVAVAGAAPVLEAKQQAKNDAVADKIPVSSETVEVQPAQSDQEQSTQSQVAQLNADALNKDIQLQVQSAEQPSTNSLDESRVAKAKPAGGNGDSGAQSASASSTAPQDLPIQIGTAGVNGRSLTQLMNLQPESAPLWTITPTGGLRRSVDQGTSWQDIDVNAANAQLNGLTGATVASTTRTKKIRSFNKAADVKTAAPVFRALTVAGSDVWAGGASGVLYHSIDAGGQWTRVTPLSGGIALTADVVGIEFSDAQHGKITTSTAETWTTADAGQSWQKQ